MPRKQSRPIILNAAIFIVLEFAALAMLRSSSDLQDIWFNRISHRTIATFWGGGEKIRNYLDLEKQNEALLIQNAELQNKIQIYESQLNVLDEIYNLPDYNDRAFRYIPAKVVKMSRSQAHNYIILNKGSEDGVKPQSGILTPQGVVGIIKAVDKHYSYAVSLRNTSLTISTIIGPQAVSSFMVWDGLSSNKAIVKDIPAHFKISVGDTVRTSGFSNIFPSNIPLGVCETSFSIDGSTQQATVALFQDLSSVHYVTIAENLDKAEIESLEQKGGR